MSEYRIYLASNSPRRRELLDQIGVTHRVLRVDVAGAVRAPRVYTLPPGSIVADAIGSVRLGKLSLKATALPYGEGDLQIMTV